MQSRWHSVTAWTSIVSLILLVLKNKYNIELRDADTSVSLIFTALIAFGILNDPTNREGF
jgi:uncharacterized membrane protein